MALETGTFIDSLNANNPAITDQIDQGDDHIRLIKSTIKSTFPSITGAVTLTHTQINTLETRMGTAETNLNSLDAAILSNDSDLATLDAGKANIAGDTFTGDVTIQGTTTLGTATATTVTTSDSSTNIATTSFVQQNISALDPLPSGMIVPFAGSSTPAGWLLCFGQSVAQADYPDLYAALGSGSIYGGDSTHFTLPDLRGRVIAGKDDMGGTAATTLTSSSAGGLDGTVLGQTGGVQEVTLTGAQSGLKAHTHGDNFALVMVFGSDENNTTGGLTAGSGTGNSLNSGLVSGSVSEKAAEDADNAHSNVQPTVILNYIVKT